MTVLLALALAAGAPPLLLAAGWLAASSPPLALVTAGGWVLWARRRERHRMAGVGEAAYLRGVAAELAGGASLRRGLTAAAGRAPGLDLRRVARLCDAGAPWDRVATSAAEALPGAGRQVAAAIEMTAQTGAPAADLFSTIAAGAAEEERLSGERRAMSAQARASAFVIAGLPVGVVALLVVSGRLAVGDGPGPMVMALGLVLQAAGLTVMGLMIRGAR